MNKMKPTPLSKGVVTIPMEWDSEDVSRMCAGWKASEITFPQGFGVRIKEALSMFSESQVSTINFPRLFGSQIVEATKMFFHCRKLKMLTLPPKFGAHIQAADFMFIGMKVKTLELPVGFGARITDASYMFSDCSNLEELSLPDKFGNNLREAAFMFEDCKRLRELSVPNNFGHRLTDAVNMFRGCVSLHTIIVRGDALSPQVRSELPSRVFVLYHSSTTHPHPLRRATALPSAAYANGYVCDQCGKHGQIPIPAHCSKCNYDLCASCSFHKRRLQKFPPFKSRA